MLSQNEVHHILELLDRQLLFFAGSTHGTQYLTKDELQILKNHNINVDKLYNISNDLVVNNYHLGMLSNVLGDVRTKSMTYGQLYKYIQSGQHIPLNQTEKAVVNSIKTQSMSDIRAARGRIFQDVNNVVNNQFNNARANQEEFLREKIKEGVEQRKSRKNIAREIAKQTGDWSRNFNKSVQYISHTALNEGRAAMIERRYEGGSKEAKMYFQVQPDACDNCVKHYLTSGRGSEPKIFTLAELQSNGTNIGRKQKDWLPVLSALHVHCRCLVTEYIEGMEWNGNRFVWPEKKEPSVNRKKVRIEFNGKEYYV